MQLESKEQNNRSDIPLLVDLDGSLIATDTLYETAVLFIRQYPLKLLMLFVWFVQGKNILKRELFNHTELIVECLPYRQDVLEYLEQQRNSGRNIVLCTGSWFGIAKKIADKILLTDQLVTTDNQKNLTGSNKADYAIDTWGKQGYDYLGNEVKDLQVWKNARRALVVGSVRLADSVEQIVELEKHFIVKPAGLKTWLKAIRIHQWAKNALLFVPLLTAQKVSHLDSLTNVLIAFLCFGLCASATYLLNDLLDLESDRKHKIKKNRPLAAGRISIPQGVFSSVILLCISMSFAVIYLNQYFLLALLFYLLLTVLYSFKLKSLQTVDVIVLASLFTARIIAGGAAIEVPLSFWLLCFSMFVFLSLAMVKRVSELVSVERNNIKVTDKISGRGYFTADIVILQCLGGASGFIAVLVFALYINSVEVTKLYN